jgi:hypothetical protein
MLGWQRMTVEGAVVVTALSKGPLSNRQDARCDARSKMQENSDRYKHQSSVHRELYRAVLADF